MNWVDSIKAIQKAQENNQLVIFIGSGVSKNSGIPTWGELIKKFAVSMEYDEKCKACTQRTERCQNEECDNRYNYTQDEFLRIPEYYYQMDKSNNHSDYYELIQNTLKNNGVSNPIDDEVFRILPHHVITTNYDPLIENSKMVNAKLYTVVSQDSDLLSKASERYIIKMHGDLKTPKTLVLKESDYINYEQEHPLISTFIRSLLINHTFVFLGYSLNDYNLNLIIGWINYFRKVHQVSDRPHNFLIVPESPSDFEVKRLENSNISVVSLNTLPKGIEDKIVMPEDLSSSMGQQLLCYLRGITDSKVLQEYISLNDILEERYEVLKSYSKISYQDLISIYTFGTTDFIGTELFFYEKEWYDKVEQLLSEENATVVDIFQRSGVTGIQFNNDNLREDIQMPQGAFEERFQLYLDNNYVELESELEQYAGLAEKIYYWSILGKNRKDINELISEEASEIPQKDYIFILLHKMRNRIVNMTYRDRQESTTKELEQLFDTIPMKYRNAVGFLKVLFESNAQNMQKMEQFLNKQEKKYEYGNRTWYSENSFYNIWKLQTYAFDYYFFIKKNFIPLDNFSDPKEYFSYYLKVILCSYSPVASYVENNFCGLKTDRRSYPLGEIEIDMLTKYVTSKNLRAWIKKYSVQWIAIDDDVNIVKKFISFCDSFTYFGNRSWIEQILCFSIIICRIQLDNISKKGIMNAFTHMVAEVTQREAQFGQLLFESIEYMIGHLSVEDAAEEKSILLRALFSDKVYLQIVQQYSGRFEKIVKNLIPFITEQAKCELIQKIDGIGDVKRKCEVIYFLRSILNLESYKSYFMNHRKILGLERVFQLIIEKVIPFDKEIQSMFIRIIKQEDDERRAQPYKRSFPDWLLATIEYCMILKLLKFDIDLAILEPYMQYSDQLQFMLCPQGFDYSKVDTYNYMWENLIYSNEYQKFFIEHRKEILSSDLEHIFNLGVATSGQQKIVYGILLDNEDLKKFGK